MKYFAGIDLSFFDNEGRNVHLLDYGSGDGRLSVFFIKKGFNVTSVDIDPNSETKILSQLTDSEKERFSFILIKEYDSLLNYSNKFDYIICREVLEHIKYYKNTVELFERLLKLNGSCIISVPSYITEKYFSFWDSDWFDKCEHVNVFKKRDIIDLAHKNSFELEKITTHSFRRTIFWGIVTPFKVKHKMGKIYNKNKLVKFAEFVSNVICYFGLIERFGNFILPKSRVYYLRHK